MFVCLKCNKNFNKKHHLEYHVGRKRPCIKEEFINKENNETNTKIKTKLSETNIELSETNIKLSENYHNLKEIKNSKENGYRCNICEKKYKYSSALASKFNITV